jgi:LmbE family N-acetylglucosaminyl deacetylase
MISTDIVLAIGAHPDDIEYGCLGFLLSLKPSKAKHIFVGSLGSIGDSSSGKHRENESRQALQGLNPASLTFRQATGLQPKDYESISDEIYQLIENIKPDLILTMGPHDTHQEHRLIFEATISGARRSKASILSYGILSNTPQFSPNFFFDVGEVFETKKTLLKEHQSQKQKYYMSEEYLNIFHGHNYAALHGFRFCEAYEVVRLFGGQ